MHRPRILLTGGAGYLGSTLLRKLLIRDYAVTALDSLLYGDESIRDLYDHPGLHFIRSDIRDTDTVYQAMQDVDAVVHLAAIVGDEACAIDPVLSEAVNYAASLRIAEACARRGVERLIFASTCSVYGAGSGCLTEESEFNPMSIYASTKAHAERAIREMAGNGSSVCILRAGTLFGLSPRMRFDLVVNILTARAVIDREFTVFGGQQWRPLLHVADAADGYLRCLEAPVDVINKQVFNLGADQHNLQIDDVAAAVEKLVPGTTVHVDTDSPDARDYRVSFAKIRNALGFSAKMSVPDAVMEMKLALEAHPGLNYRSSKYSNYMTLRSRQGVEAFVHTPDLIQRKSADWREPPQWVGPLTLEERKDALTA